MSSVEAVTKPVPLSDITKLPGLQIRAATDAGTVARYANAMRNGATFPAITVARIDGAYAVVDGWHRLYAAQQNGQREIEATIVPCNGIEEARWMAAEANLRHGLPLKRKAVREVFRAYVRAKKHRKGRMRMKSYREIAEDLQGLVSHSGVRNWMQKDFPAVYQMMGGGDECPHGVGGLAPAPSGVTLHGHIGDIVADALAAFRGVRSPEDRGQIIAHWRQALVVMEAAGEWVEPPPEEEPEF